MHQNDYQYLQWLQSCIQKQEERINSLEAIILQMTEELKQLKEKPTIHVDKIDYKFDQLKVETLEGTLNIGLNPSELQGIEDFAVKDNTSTPPPNPKAQMERSMEIEEAIMHYLETELPAMIQETRNRLNIHTNNDYLSFIKEDIIKQLPTRIDFHLKSLRQSEKTMDEAKRNNQRILEVIKGEIKNGVSIFFHHLPEDMKGMNHS